MRTLRSFLPLLLLVTMPLLLAGCGDDDDPAAAGGGGDALQGTWEAVSATRGGQSLDLATAMNWTAGAVRSTILFGPGTALAVAELDAADNVVYLGTGTFAVSGNAITLTFTEENGQPDSEVIGGTWSVSDTTLALNLSFPDGTLTITCTKI